MLIVSLIVSVLCLTFILYKWINHIEKSPQYNCNHSFNTFLALRSDIGDVYLSTCSKCGKQNKHKV